MFKRGGLVFAENDQRGARAACFAAGILTCAAIGACDGAPPETAQDPYANSAYGSPDWSPSTDEGMLASRDYKVPYARRWTGDCDMMVAVPAEDGGEILTSASDFAADYGSRSALACLLPRVRQDLAGPPDMGDAETNAFIVRMQARVVHHYLFRADLRGMDVYDEIIALCDEWGWDLHPENAEQRARGDFADAVEAGLLRLEDLEAAKARDATRPTCSERLRSRGSQPPWEGRP